MRVLADEPTLCTHDDTPSALMAALYQFMFRAAGAITARRESLTVFEAAAMGETAQLSDRLAARARCPSSPTTVSLHFTSPASSTGRER